MLLPLKGIIPPMITPLKNNDELDRNGVANLIEHIIGGGVHGLFLLGTNGEGPSLSYRLKKEFIKLSCEIIQGRVPVLVGVTDSSFSGAMEMAEYSKTVGADSIVVAPPFYFPATEAEMINYVEKLAAAAPLPFVLYNMPMHTKINLMNELTKIKRVMQKVIPDAPHEVLLVLDGSTGQNATIQAREFTKATEVTALAITKLDGTAKGGVVIGISDEFKIPVKYIGVGEKIDDLQVFNKTEFVDSLFKKN